MSEETLDEFGTPPDAIELLFNRCEKFIDRRSNDIADALFGIAMTVFLGVKRWTVRRKELNVDLPVTSQISPHVS
jgi:hypothetical protein